MKAWKRYHLKNKFGISGLEYERMLEKQKGVCAICGKAENVEKRALAVDHCHTTGKIRGLLCLRCNRGLGLFNDDPDILWEAMQYVKR